MCPRLTPGTLHWGPPSLLNSVNLEVQMKRRCFKDQKESGFRNRLTRSVPGHRLPFWGTVLGSPAAEEGPSLTYRSEQTWEEDPHWAPGSQRGWGPQSGLVPCSFGSVCWPWPPSGAAIPASVGGTHSADRSPPYHPGFSSFPWMVAMGWVLLGTCVVAIWGTWLLVSLSMWCVPLCDPISGVPGAVSEQRQQGRSSPGPWERAVLWDGASHSAWVTAGRWQELRGARVSKNASFSICTTEMLGTLVSWHNRACAHGCWQETLFLY